MAGNPRKRPWRARISHSKVKTGCLSCSKRRIKCDEAKPECMQCRTFGVDCDGYRVSSFLSTANSSLAGETMAPRLGGTLNSCSSVPRIRRDEGRPASSRELGFYGRCDADKKKGNGNSKRVILPALSLQVTEKLRYRNHDEFQYLRVYQDEFATAFTGAFESSIWDKIMLQTAHHQQFVFDSIVALSALSMSMQTNSDKKTHITNHYLVAMTYYDKALQAMRQVISDPSQDLRTILISCLLVFCFESLQGYQASAVSHVRSGCKLFRQSLAKSGQHCSSKRISIEADIMHAFERLDLQVLLTVDKTTVGIHKMAKQKNHGFLLTMPAQFAGLDEADTYWQILMRRCADFVQVAAMVSGSSLSLKKAEVVEGMSSSLLGFSSSIHTPFLSDAVLRKLTSDKSLYAQELRRWESAFDPFCRFPYPTIKRGVIFRRIRFLSTQLVVESTVVTEECSYDKFLNIFQEIVTLSKEFVQGEVGCRYRFSADLGIIPSLYIVAKMCRHSVTRREAIAILEVSPRREGIWDGILVSKIARWLMEVEEEGLEGAFIPELARVRITNVDVDVPARSARLNWMRRTALNSSTYVSYESAISW